MAIVFDGPNKIITLDTTTTQQAADIYSRWKDWVRIGDNAKFLPAFDNSVGGNPTVPPESLDGYYFLNNEDGWRIRPPEQDGEYFLNGNLFGNNATLPIFTVTLGSFNAFIRQLFSARSLVSEVGTSGLTAAEAAQLNLAVELMESDQFYDVNTGLLHYYRKGTTIDIIPAKSVTGAQQLSSVTIEE